MNRETDSRICTNEQCKFSETDLCVEGNDINECPYLQICDATVTEDGKDIKSPDSPAKQAVDELVHFGGEEHLSVTEASILLKARYMPIIAFLGPPGAGKTSLIAEVYDAFQYGNYESLAFAGSETLMAFERICHKVRAVSRAPEPMHDRSEILDDPFFFHLIINASCNMRPVDILLADRSGETYRTIADTPNIADQCLELKRAAALNILVDGNQLCDTRQRTGALNGCVQALQALTFKGVPAQGVPINLVLTKLDIVDSHENMKRAHQEFDKLVARLPSQVSSLNTGINPFKIAACPQNNMHPKGFGVETLIKSWVSSKPPQGTYSNPVLNSERAMSRAPSSLGVS